MEVDNGGGLDIGFIKKQKNNRMQMGKMRGKSVMAEEIEGIRVQELTEMTNGSPPERFIQNESNRPISYPPLATIPVIDLSYIESKDLEQRQHEDSRLKSASLSWGLFQVVGHGIPTSLLDEVRNVTRLFFQQSLKAKQSYSSEEQIPDLKEGYGNDAILSHEQILDWNDKLFLQVYPEQARNMDLWPQEPTSFRGVVNEFNEELMMVVDEIFKALARNLGLEEGYFINHGAKGRINWRFNYYPCCSRPDLVLGLKTHSDGSTFTILLPDDQVPGLQVFNDELGWVEVPILPPSALLVIMGDEMEIMSNGQYKSLIHKVVTNSEKERISLSMFVLSEFEKELGPIDDLIEERKPRLYKKIKAKDYGDVFFLDFAQGKRSIDSMKV